MLGLFIIPGLLLLGVLASAAGVFDIDIEEGSSGTDEIDGGSGDDSLRGGEGDDLIEGGDGDDLLSGDEDNDIVLGQQGNDTVIGAADEDIVSGGRGNDLVFGGGDVDLLLGDQGNDVVTGGGGADVQIGGRGDDLLVGERGNDILIGGEVDGLDTSLRDFTNLRDGAPTGPFFRQDETTPVDIIDRGNDTLEGGKGADTLFIGRGDVTVGGEGPDTFAALNVNQNNQVAEIADFDATQDVVGIVAPLDSPDPDIRITAQGGDAIVLTDGNVVARVVGAEGRLSADDIVLVAPPQAGDFNPFPAG